MLGKGVKFFSRDKQTLKISTSVGWVLWKPVRYTRQISLGSSCFHFSIQGWTKWHLKVPDSPRLCLFDDDDCIFIHQLVGLFTGKSNTHWDNTSLDFRASLSESELKSGINFLPFLASWDDLSFPHPHLLPGLAMHRIGCPLSLLLMHLLLHGPPARESLSSSGLRVNSSLLHLPCSFQPPLQPSASEAFDLLRKREWVLPGLMVRVASVLPFCAGLYKNPIWKVACSTQST